MSKANPQGKSRASKPRQLAAKSKSSPRIAAKSRGSANEVNKPKTGAVAMPATGTAACRIDQRIQSLGGWRAETLATVRRLIHEADSEIAEEIKWIKPTNPLGVPVWSHAGIVCAGESYKQVVKLTFARGAALADPKRLFNSSLEGNTRRAIDIREGETLDARAFKALILAAVAENLKTGSAKSKSMSAPSVKPKGATRPSAWPKGVEKSKPIANARPTTKKLQPVKLLSGGNPQIAKAEGDAPVQAYIAAMPGWKSELGKRLDALIVRNVPSVRKAVKWNSPFYGIEGQGWFLSFHVLTRYVKVTFFSGMLLHPVPPGGTPKSKDARWIDIYEDDRLDEAQMARWVKQAAAIPGWLP